MTQSTSYTQDERSGVEARIVGRLRHLDDDMLHKLDQIAEDAESISLRRAGSQPHTSSPTPMETPTPSARLSRRQVLTRLLLGGTAVAATGYLLTRDNAPDAPSEIARNLLGNDEEKSALETLLSLYEIMDQVGLDGLVASALVLLGFSLDGIKGAATALRAAIGFVAGMIDRFESAVPQILSGIQAVDAIIETLQGYMAQLETIINDALAEAAPLTAAVDKFVDSLLALLPFGIGERIRAGLETMGAVVGLLPQAVQAVGDGLLSPMRTWFPTGDAEDMRALLFTPIRAEVLIPTAQLLDDLIAFAERWDDDLAQPVQASLAQRQEIRGQIAMYKERIGVSFDVPSPRAL